MHCVSLFLRCHFVLRIKLIEFRQNITQNLRILYLTGQNACFWKHLLTYEALLQLSDIACLCFHHQKKFPWPSDSLPPVNIFLFTKQPCTTFIQSCLSLTYIVWVKTWKVNVKVWKLRIISKRRHDVPKFFYLELGPNWILLSFQTIVDGHFSTFTDQFTRRNVFIYSALTNLYFYRDLCSLYVPERERAVALLTISFPEPTCLLVSTKTRSSGIINKLVPRAFVTSAFKIWYCCAFKAKFRLPLSFQCVLNAFVERIHIDFISRRHINQATHAPWSRKS